MNASSSPVVGIAGAGYVVQRFWGELPVRGVPTSYVDAVAAAGGRPVVLPPGHGVEVLDLVDAVVLAGGDDIGVDPARDHAEIALVLACRARGIPLLGVCRGLQLLAVADGGSLVADLGADLPHVKPEVGHPVHTSPGSMLSALLGGEPVVSSLHHQAVDRPGSGWLPTCRAADGCIEGLEWIAPRSWPALGVQWHPELDATGSALFGWLVEHARRQPMPCRSLRRATKLETGAGILAGRSPQS